MNLKHGIWALGAVIALGVACSDDDDENNTPTNNNITPIDNNNGGSNNNDDPIANNNNTANTSACDTAGVPFDAPSATVCDGFAVVNFSIDDSATQFFTADDFLAWKGGFGWDPEAGPYGIMNSQQRVVRAVSVVYDDGPWNEGGHEPAGAVAGDSIWGIAAFFDLSTLPASGEKEIPYGAIRDSNENGDDGQWIWNRFQPSNGSFVVGVDDDGMAVDATNLTLPTFGDIDVRFTVDTATIQALDLNEDNMPDFPQWDPANGLRVKSSWWDWIDTPLNANNDNSQFTVELSGIASVAELKTGLLSSGSVLQFVFVLAESAEDGVEYKADNQARSEGITVRGQGGRRRLYAGDRRSPAG